MSLWGFIKSIGKTIKSAICSLIEDAETRNDKIKVKDVRVIKGLVFDDESLFVPDGDELKNLDKDQVEYVICLTEDAAFEVDIERFTRFDSGKKKWHKARLYVTFKRGFKTNGTSAPKFFQTELPAYLPMVKGNADIYNLAAFVHDGLYACHGEIAEKGIPNEKNDKRRHTLARRECDNLLSGIWRISDFVDDITAKIAEKGVNLFAGGPEHWDNDELRCKENFNVTIEYL
jgi:hypothetical protein